MKELVSTITSKGQVTIPGEIRRHLGVKPNDKISFVIEEDGSVRVKVPPYPDVASLRGTAGSLRESLSWSQVREIAREDRLLDKVPLTRSSPMRFTPCPRDGYTICLAAAFGAC